MTDIKNAKTRRCYHCENCDFITCNKYDYNKHLTTDKHKILTNTYAFTYENTQKNAKTYDCPCGKTYKHRQSLQTHKKKCQQEPTFEIIEKKDDNVNQDLIMELIKDNKEMKQIIMEQNKIVYEQSKTIHEMMPKLGNVTNNTNNITNNNNVNITVFLNDNCKDALSMEEFIQQIKIGVGDLLFTGKNGLTTGLSNIFIESYNKLPLVKRPLWCSDKKRKRLFIKNEVWEEDKDSIKTKEAIKQLGVMQAKSTPLYTKDNPDWIKSEKTKDIYIGIIKQTTGDVNEKIDKIIDTITDNAHLNVDTREKIVNEK
jgi:hypothetical protein